MDKKYGLHKNVRNPILPPGLHIPDPEAHVMPDGKLYLYGSLDNREDMFCSDEYRVISTSDMETWEISDVALRGQEIPWFNNPDAPKYQGIDWYNPTPFIHKMIADMDVAAEQEKFESGEETLKFPFLFAPDAIHMDGKYYLYFCMSDDSEGVAVSESPTGPFTNPQQIACGGIDPAIFKDEDGQVYFYWGQLYSRGVPLNDDMTTFDEAKVVENLVTEEEHFFHEGSSMRKIGDTYYMVYSSIAYGKPTSLSYATGKSPLGPFEYGGVIINNEFCDPKSWNNHGSIECFNDQWYIFYHRSSRGSQRYRRLCIEPITINSDGTIDEVKMTSQGLGNPFKLADVIMGYQACELHGQVYIDVEAERGIGEKLTNLTMGDSVLYRYLNFDEAPKHAELTAQGTGKLAVFQDGSEIGELSIKDGQQLSKVVQGVRNSRSEVELKCLESQGLEIYDLCFIG